MPVRVAGAQQGVGDLHRVRPARHQLSPELGAAEPAPRGPAHGLVEVRIRGAAPFLGARLELADDLGRDPEDVVLDVQEGLALGPEVGEQATVSEVVGQEDAVDLEVRLPEHGEAQLVVVAAFGIRCDDPHLAGACLVGFGGLVTMSGSRGDRLTTIQVKGALPRPRIAPRICTRLLPSISASRATVSMSRV